MTTLQTQFEQLLEKQRAMKIEFQKVAQEMFKQTTKEFFDKNPMLTAIIWTQYTPYFNDGDTCEFGVSDPTFTNAPDYENVRYGEYEGDGEGVITFETWIMNLESSYVQEARKEIDKYGIDKDACNHFAQLIQSSEMESVMEAMFGDHVRVIATRDGFDVSEYDHD